jgi:hypothetical protein
MSELYDRHSVGPNTPDGENMLSLRPDTLEAILNCMETVSLLPVLVMARIH